MIFYGKNITMNYNNNKIKSIIVSKNAICLRFYYFSGTYFHFCLDFTLVGLTIVYGMELEKSGFSNNEQKITLRN